MASIRYFVCFFSLILIVLAEFLTDRGPLLNTTFMLSGFEPRDILKTSFLVDNCPKEVEVVVRTQPDKKRLILHLLNYNAHRLDAVGGVKVKVLVGPRRRLSAFYPKDGRSITYEREGDYISFDVREFSVHEMVVIEQRF